MDTLKTALLDLARHFELQGLRLILGGGLGLYLRQLNLAEHQTAETLLPGEDWFPPRATDDMDILLTTEVVADPKSMETVRKILDQLGYRPSVEFLQFLKPVGEGSVKVDLLTGPIPSEYQARVKVKRPRVRSSAGSTELHAYLADDALGFDTANEEIELEGSHSDGRPGMARVWILNPFTYLMMKLHAFRDREKRGALPLAQKHALDLFRTVSMLKRDDFDLVRSLVIEYSSSPIVDDARSIRNAFFSSESSRGVILLRTAWRDAGETLAPNSLEQFLEALREIFAQDDR